MEQHEWIVAAAYVKKIHEAHERGSRLGKLAGQKHLPVVAFCYQGVELFPCIATEEMRQLTQGLLFDECFGNNDELSVLDWDIKMMGVVAEVIAIGEDPAARTDRERKRKTALITVATRMHARFHHAFADHVAVVKLGEVPDGEEFHMVSEVCLRQKEQRALSSECNSRRSNRESGCIGAECREGRRRYPAPQPL